MPQYTDAFIVGAVRTAESVKKFYEECENAQVVGEAHVIMENVGPTEEMFLSIDEVPDKLNLHSKEVVALVIVDYDSTQRDMLLEAVREIIIKEEAKAKETEDDTQPPGGSAGSGS